VIWYWRPRYYQKRRLNMKPTIARNFKVLFCGKGHFRSGYEYTKEALSSYPDIAVVESDSEKILENIHDSDVIVPLMTRISEDLLLAATNLKLIMQFGVGLEGVNISKASERGILVANIPSSNTGNAASCAEHAIFLALSLLRNTKEMKASIETGRLGYPTGKTLLGSTSLLYGYGGIGEKLGSLLSSFGSKVFALKRDENRLVELKEKHPEIEEIGITRDFPRLAACADLIFMCCNQNSDTFGIVNKKFLSQVKQGTYIVNVARVSLQNQIEFMWSFIMYVLASLQNDMNTAFKYPLEHRFSVHFTPEVSEIFCITRLKCHFEIMPLQLYCTVLCINLGRPVELSRRARRP